MQAPTFTWRGVVDGAREGILISPTLIAFGVAVGVLAASKGLTVLEIALMSAWVYAGGAQMATLQVWAEPLPLFALMLTVLAMNARYVLLSAALRPPFGTLPAWQIYPGLAIFGDGNWALQMREISEGRRPDAGFLLGSGLVMFIPWIGVHGRRPPVRAGPRRSAPARHRFHPRGVLRHDGGRIFSRRAQHRAADRRHRGGGRWSRSSSPGRVSVRRRARRKSRGAWQHVDKT